MKKIQSDRSGLSKWLIIGIIVIIIVVIAAAYPSWFTGNGGGSGGGYSLIWKSTSLSY